MNTQTKNEITQAAKEFASAFEDTIGGIKGSGWLIVDPLSGFLNASGYENKLVQIPANENHPQVLVMIFKDGSQFIPAGSDLPIKGSHNWMWV